MVILVPELVQASRPPPPYCSAVLMCPSWLPPPHRPHSGQREAEGGSMSFLLREYHCYIFICIYICSCICI